MQTFEEIQKLRDERLKNSKVRKNSNIKNIFDPDCVTPNEKNKIRLSSGRLYKFMGKQHMKEIMELKIKLPNGYYMYKNLAGENINVSKFMFNFNCVQPNENTHSTKKVALI